MEFFETITLPKFHIAATLGFLLAASLAAGLLGELFRLPKVTSYLLVGILFGPALHWVPHDQVEQLKPLLKLAMGLVLFQLGSHFPISQVKAISKRLLTLSGGELGLTFLLVTSGVFAVSGNLPMALLLGTLALATAPATTLLVLKETQSEGPVTELASGLVAVNNFASIVLFELIFVAIAFVNGGHEMSVLDEVGLVIRDVIGSLALGGLMGFAISYSCGFIKTNHWLVLLVAINSILLGLCESYGLSYMLAFLTMGFVVVNTSELSYQISAEINRLTGLLIVTFFVIHGTEMDLEAFAKSGLLGTVYIITRCAGKYFGIRGAAVVAKETSDVKNWLGSTLLAQAGAAIALSEIVVKRDPELGKEIQNIIIGTVVFFELIGPLLIRQSVLRAGEVPVTQAIRHQSTTWREQLQGIWDRLRVSTTEMFDAENEPQERTVEQIMRPHVHPIKDAASFDEVLSFIEHSHDDTYPVVDKENVLQGIIRYRELSSAMFDPEVNLLIRANDMAVECWLFLHPDQTASDAVEAFRKGTDDCIPVVSREKPHQFLGVIRRRDVTRLLARKLGST